MKQRMIKVTAKRGKKAKGGKIRHIILTPAENGFTAEHHFAMPESKDEPMQMPPDPETHVVSTPEELGSHVSRAFGGRNLAPKEEAAETPAEEAGEEENDGDE